MAVRTYVYVDGFNLYYGAVRGTPYKWLNIRRLSELLLPGHSVDAVKYFTARVSARKDDPQKPSRQQIYLRALRTLPGLEIVYGSFLSHDVMMLLAEPAPGAPKFAKVTKTEEKGSDVNLATHLMHDAYLRKFDSAVLVTNDSDLLEPIRIVRRELNLEVGILNPHNQNPSRVLLQHASFVKQIRAGALRASQFPDELTDSKGLFRKPRTW
ncbi:MAG TPA: NYN domain-containing protein [Anaerolineales bacterium]|nr:NYN domain-containing protein [Anaerolineales bacterium]